MAQPRDGESSTRKDRRQPFAARLARAAGLSVGNAFRPKGWFDQRFRASHYRGQNRRWPAPEGPRDAAPKTSGGNAIVPSPGFHHDGGIVVKSPDGRLSRGADCGQEDAAMTYATVEIEQAAGVATIWMNRPEQHNAFNPALIADLTAALAAVEGDAAVRVIVLAGRGNSFSSGADLAWMKEAGAKDYAANHADARRLAEVFRLLAGSSKPTIARIHGAAFGAGVGLAAACDICVAADHATFTISEVRFGLIPSAISPYILRAIGPRQALRYFQTAERLTATRALDLGLVHEIVEVELIDDRIAKFAHSLSKGGPKALAAAKALIARVAWSPVDETLVEDTARRIAEVRASDEAKEGIAAFAEKRPPSWSR
jgi:methylglutaconyl-CoA hydratase